MKKSFYLLLTIILIASNLKAQEARNGLGAWYMYFWNTNLKESKFGLQGDVQYRDWEILGDFQQLIFRGGVTYSPNSDIKLVAGYGNFTSGPAGESSTTSNENRLYQDVNLPHKVGSRIFINHRLRYEQRWVEGQDFRTRYRYALFIKVPLNKSDFKKNSIFLSLSNETFINGQTDIGKNRRVDYFDRNWLYGALGYAIKDNLNIQLGFLNQATSNSNKNQLQLGIHHSF